jgi:hypothetical protein
LRRARLDVHELKPRLDPVRLFRIVVLLPLALAGAVVSYPQFRLVGVLARRFSKGEDAMVATIKFLAALAVYPVTYLAIAIGVGLRFDLAIGVATAAVLPILGYLALVVYEDFDDVIGDLRAIRHRIFRNSGYARLIARRRKILQELVEVSREMGG